MLTPTEVRSYLQARGGTASLPDLCHHFRADERQVAQVLAIWEKKGKVRQQTGCRQGSCSGCASSETVWYCWEGTPTASANAGCNTVQFFAKAA
ncbi:MAG: FeoC-like transcriptional regulator [Zoogloeaceae bacterium]|jgi:hypothetical protein|nr:FeoC-like transcriptional regulator [Zoogloeaceae bacterium]